MIEMISGGRVLLLSKKRCRDIPLRDMLAVPICSGENFAAKV